MRVINEDAWISRCLIETGEHSQSELNLMQLCLGLLSHGRYDGVVVDGGAFIGDHTIPLSRLCKKLYAFEPHAGIREILEHNLLINGCTNVEVLPWALGDSAHDVSYNTTNLQQLPDGTSLASPGGTQMAVEGGDAIAGMRSLDELDLGPLDFIKADIEGMEIPMLSGAQETLRKHRSTLFLEYDTVVMSDLRPLPEVLELLGYKAYPMAFPMWSVDNFRGAPNTFGSTVGKMMLAMADPRYSAERATA